MTRLYRSAEDLQHWFVYLDGAGWQRFPAKAHGWSEHMPVQGLQSLNLREVPMWMQFQTGLLEAVSLRKVA